MWRVLGMAHFYSELRSGLRFIGQGAKDIRRIKKGSWIPGCYRVGNIDISQACDKTELSKPDQPCQRKAGVSFIQTLSYTYIRCFGYLDTQAENSISFLVCYRLKSSAFHLCTQQMTEFLKVCHIPLFVFHRQSLHCFTITGEFEESMK